MASAKLEILISAKDAASQVMGKVRGAFYARAMEIRNISDGLVKHGEKVEKFLHGVSLLKLATETESVKSALDSVSPSLQKFTSNMLNAGLAVGGTLSLMKDMAHLSKMGPGAGVAGFVAAVGAGTVALGQGYLDMKDEQRGAVASGQRLAFGAAEAARNARSAEAFDAAMMSLRDAVLQGVEGASETAVALAGQRDAIIAANKARDAQTNALNQQAKALKEETKRIHENFAALGKVRAILAERALQTPAGQFAEMQNVTKDLANFQAMNINPETQPQLWLEREKQVAALTARLEAVNAGPIGKVRDLFAAIRDGAQGLLRRRTGGSTTTNLGPLPGSAILSDSLSRQGLFAGGGRANPLTGLTDRTLVSIDSATKEQVRLMRGIWQALTKGNLDALTE